MAAYIKELCLDYAINRVTLLEKVDIELGVKRLLETGQIDLWHLRVAADYVNGYTIAELTVMYSNVTERLTQFFSLLAAEIHYTDEFIVNLAVRRNPKYAKTIDAYRRKLEAYGRDFT